VQGSLIERSGFVLWHIDCFSSTGWGARKARSLSESVFGLDMKKSKLITSCAVLAGLSFSQSQVALAGWSGQMNGIGIGRTTANVTSASGAPSTATSITSAPGQSLSAAVKQIPQPTGYSAFNPLPTGANGATSALIKGLPGYIWQASTYAIGGDRTDNETIQAMADIAPAPFAQLSISITITEDFDNNTRTLNVAGLATGGTALFVEAFQTGPTTQSKDGEFTGFQPLDIFYSNLFEGKGQPLAGAPIDSESIINFSKVLEGAGPKDIPKEEFVLRIEGFAASTAPDGGWLGLSFALTVAGMFFARRFVVLPTA
jgi:hypothetical protein